MDRVSSMLSFVKVVEHEGFSSAARQLNLGTSVVTTHVKSLEERLRVRLLNRTTRSVSLTEVGREYYERCVQILSEIEDAEQAAQVLQSRPRECYGSIHHPAFLLSSLHSSPNTPIYIRRSRSTSLQPAGCLISSSKDTIWRFGTPPLRILLSLCVGSRLIG